MDDGSTSAGDELRTALERVRALEEALEQRDAYVAALCHSVRSPTVALSFATTLLRAAPDDAARARVLDAIQASADALTELIDGVLDHDALAALPRVDPAPLEAASVVRAVTAAVGPFASTRQVAVRADGAASTTALGHPGLLRHVLLDAALAVLHAPEPPGTLTVQTSDGDGVLVVLRREPPPAQVPDRARALAEARLALFGGGVVRWDPDQVAVRLPKATPVAPGAPEARPARSGGTVLLVEDDPVQRQLATLALRSGAWVVECPTSTEEAVRWATERPYDVLLLDAVTDGASQAALRGARESRVNRHTPVVLISAHNRNRAAVWLGQEPDGYVAKPYRPSALLAELERVVDG